MNRHSFHIPVMGTGHTIDSPIRVAHLGINSVISIVDDLLCDKVRRHYAKIYNLPWQSIPRSDRDGRAKRITAWLDLVGEVVQKKFEEIRQLPLFSNSEKDRYFQLLPDAHPPKKAYRELSLDLNSPNRIEREKSLTDAMKAGSIDVNIMAKVDALGVNRSGEKLPAEFSDASSALRGFAESRYGSGLVLSAGFNPRLYSYLSQFRDFYRDRTGRIRKRLILKVSDFRSALIQGKFLAKKGLEVAEFRIESGLNCGGHAFPSDGQLLPMLLEEFREKRDQLTAAFHPLIAAWYEEQGLEFQVQEEELRPALTVQGGIGTSGEIERLIEAYGVDGTGWGSPFLLVPEATCVDEETMDLLTEAREEDLFLSEISPLGVPFNTVRGSGSERHTEALVDRGKPGSKCPKGFLVSNTEFTEEPICTASAQYQLLKIDQINSSDQPESEKADSREKVLEKRCLCTNLGTGSLIRLGIMKPSYGRQEICPGPNIAWFSRKYTLEEMVDHIYGRGSSLVPSERPHIFAHELVMYVDYLERRIRADRGQTESREIRKISSNLMKGIEVCLEIAAGRANRDENLDSLRSTARSQRQRIERLMMDYLDHRQISA